MYKTILLLNNLKPFMQLILFTVIKNFSNNSKLWIIYILFNKHISLTLTWSLDFFISNIIYWKNREHLCYRLEVKSYQ